MSCSSDGCWLKTEGDSRIDGRNDSQVLLRNDERLFSKSSQDGQTHAQTTQPNFGKFVFLRKHSKVIYAAQDAVIGFP